MNSTNAVPEIPAIENMVIKGVEQGLYDLFDMPEQSVLFVASTDRMRIADKAAKMISGADSTISYPLMFLRLDSAAPGTVDQIHAYNAKSLSRMGRYIKLNDSKNSVLNVHLVPAILELELVYLVDDFQKAFKFATSWVAHALNNRLNFSINYGGQSLDIRCVMSDQVSTPPREEAVDQPNAFEYTTTIRVAGYVNDPAKSGISQVDMVGPGLSVDAKSDSEFVMVTSQQSKVWGKT